MLVTLWEPWHHFLHRDLAFSPRLGVNRRVKCPLIPWTNSVGSVEERERKKKGSGYQPHEPGIWVAVVTVLDSNSMSWNRSRAVDRDNLVLVRGMCLNRRGIQCYAYDGAIINMTDGELSCYKTLTIELWRHSRESDKDHGPLTYPGDRFAMRSGICGCLVGSRCDLFRYVIAWYTSSCLSSAKSIKTIWRC